MQAPGTVLVTGGSGYIAGYLIRNLLGAGWRVHTTLRSRSREVELRERLSVRHDGLRCFEADLLADDGWAEASAGCTHVAHLASPVPARVPRDADELIRPARDGVLRALRAARAAGTVRRFVMTSSVAAIAYGHGRGTHRFTEADWTNLATPGVPPYMQSKTLAERAAREWMAGEGRGAFEFASICPSVVLGPVWSRDYSSSVLIVRKLLEGGLPVLPDIGFGVVDVRDLATLHAMALTEPGLDGERFIASGRFMKLAEIADVLHRGLGAEARRVPRLRVPDFVVRLVAKFSPMARGAAQELGSVRETVAGHAAARLGWRTRSEAESILDCARSLLDLGIVRP